jgi:hypothetical protein
MTPSWNITGCIIEPGGFTSQWAATSAQPVPLHLAYDDPANPSYQMRQYRQSLQDGSLGSPHKMADALLKLANEPELPFRIQFGSESLFIVRSQAKRTMEDAEKWAHVAHSTNEDGKSGKDYVLNRLLASGRFDDSGREWVEGWAN